MEINSFHIHTPPVRQRGPTETSPNPIYKIFLVAILKKIKKRGEINLSSLGKAHLSTVSTYRQPKLY
jgi:hypothetical protein